MRTRRSLGVVAGWAVCAALAGGLGGVLPVQAQDLTYRFFEREQRERTTIGREQPALQQWMPAQAALRIDSVSGARIFVGSADGPGDRAVLAVAPDRRVLSLVPVPDPRQTRMEGPPMPAEDSLWRERARFIGYHRMIRLPEQDLRWLARQLGPVPVPGVPVTDTLVFTARHAEFADSVRIVRTRVARGDTLLDGRRLLVVRDSAVVTEWATWPIRLRSMGADETRVRTLAGTSHGTTLIDPGLGVAVVAHDTARLEGDLRVVLPDGRALATSTTVERVERVTSHAPAEWAELQVARTPLHHDGMVRLPGPDEIARIEETRRMPADSLITLWLDASDYEARTDVLRRIESAHALDRAEWIARLHAAALADGDTAGALGLRFGQGASLVPVDTPFWSLVRPFLEDPGRALAFDVPVEELYDALIAGFLHSPPAVASSPGAPCSPAACSRMAEEATRATEPRLRDLGLVARLVLGADPEDAERVLERAAAGSALAVRIVPLIRGAASTWIIGERPPVPEPGADWREWLVWSGTRPPEARIEQWFTARGVPFDDPFRFDPSHVNVLRFHTLLTGRDYVTEFTDAAETAVGDSARLVYGAMRIGLGAPLPGPDAIVEHVLAESATTRALGRMEMAAFFEPNAVAADSATAVLALNGLLSLLVADAEPWSYIDETDRRHVGIGHAVEGPIVLVTDSVPGAVVERWLTRTEPIRERELSDRDPRAALTVLRPREVRVAGPFVDVTVDYETRHPVAPDRPPEVYAGGVSLRVLRRPDGWIIVSVGGWIT